MTIKETKTWLLRAWHMEREIDALIESRSCAWDRCLSVTANPSGEPTGHNTNTNDASLVRYIELSDKINNRIDKLLMIKQEILDKISEIQQGNIRQIMILRYLNYCTWEHIAVETHYSYVQVCRLHGKALLELSQKMI